MPTDSETAKARSGSVQPVGSATRKPETLAEWIVAMSEAHPRAGIYFELGIMLHRDGGKCPGPFWGRMTVRDKLYRLGWQMANREALTPNAKLTDGGPVSTDCK